MHNIKGAKILITGGAGFVGSHILDQLLDEGVGAVVLIDNLLRGSLKNIEHNASDSRLQFINGDIRDRALLDHFFQDIDYCFHMAALRITQCADNPREALDVMYNGTFNVIEACVQHQVKKIVAASSASIYGQADVFPTPETHHPYNNLTLYGAAKAANELMLRSFHHMYGLEYNAMRYFNIYGPRMDIEGKYTEVLIRWYYFIKEGKRPQIFGDGSQTMDFVYVEDVARASILALKNDVHDIIFNVASQEETSLKDLCYLLLEVMGSNLEPAFMILPEERKAVEVKKRLADTRKAKDLLGFQSSVTLKDGLKKLVKWMDNLTEKDE